MIKYIKSIVGRLTLPKDAVCYYDDLYIPCDHTPLFMVGGEDHEKYKYCYQKIKQNWLGVWVLQRSWLSTNKRITQRVSR